MSNSNNNTSISIINNDQVLVYSDSGDIPSFRYEVPSEEFINSLSGTAKCFIRCIISVDYLKSIGITFDDEFAYEYLILDRQDPEPDTIEDDFNISDITSSPINYSSFCSSISNVDSNPDIKTHYIIKCLDDMHFDESIFQWSVNIN